MNHQSTGEPSSTELLQYPGSFQASFYIHGESDADKLSQNYSSWLLLTHFNLKPNPPFSYIPLQQPFHLFLLQKFRNTTWKMLPTQK